MKIGIDASRIRSGGGIGHLLGILGSFAKAGRPDIELHIWSYDELLDQIEPSARIIRHRSALLNAPLLFQLFWQKFVLGAEVRRQGCDILFTLDAASLCDFRPSVALSQDMLSFEAGIPQRFSFGYEKLRLWAIGRVQVARMKRSDGVIFLTKHARQTIGRYTGALADTTVIAHGLDERYRQAGAAARASIPRDGEVIRCLYVSPIAPYKNQDKVIEAIGLLHARGYHVELTLVGGGKPAHVAEIRSMIAGDAAGGGSVRMLGYLSRDEMIDLYRSADIAIFASSCETFGITLLEAMACGIPIVCSRLESLRETLGDGGIYFDPTDSADIAASIEKVVSDDIVAKEIGAIARKNSTAYTWDRCSDLTFSYIESVLGKVRARS